MNIEPHLVWHKDWPKPGVNFCDLWPLFENRLDHVAEALIEKVDVELFMDKPTALKPVWGALDARGFVIASAMAYAGSIVPIRKAGKLPPPVLSRPVTKEYGEDMLEMRPHNGTNTPKMVLVDDVAATGNTLRAAADLAALCGYDVVGAAVVVDLVHLHGDLGFPLVSLHEVGGTID